MATTDKEVKELIKREYEHGFVTEIESDTFEPGLNEDVIRRLSEIKQEPEFMLEWRLKAYRRWLEMEEPEWAHVDFPKVDYNSISYYSAPKKKEDMPQSLDEVDPELLKTYEKLGIPSTSVPSWRAWRLMRCSTRFPSPPRSRNLSRKPALSSARSPRPYRNIRSW